jgi:peroxiredoxin
MELEERFSSLEHKLPDSPEKEVISLLHAMLQEARRARLSADGGSEAGNDTTLADVADLYKSAPHMGAEAENPGLRVGEPAPDFTLPDAEDHPVSLSDYRGQTVVLVFYALDWSPGCSDQLSLYQSELDEFERRGVPLIGISVDSIYSHGAWSEVRGLTFPLLADFHPKGEVARRYGVMRESDGFSERALYIVDGEGLIRHAHVSPYLHHVPDIYTLFEELDAVTGTPMESSAQEA